MGKIVDITEKLNFDKNPSLKIKNLEIEVNSDASTVLKIMYASSKPQAEAVLEMYELLFSESSRKKIDKLHLSFKDLEIVIQEAMQLITGETAGE